MLGELGVGLGGMLIEVHFFLVNLLPPLAS